MLSFLSGLSYQDTPLAPAARRRSQCDLPVQPASEEFCRETAREVNLTDDITVFDEMLWNIVFVLEQESIRLNEMQKHKTNKQGCPLVSHDNNDFPPSLTDSNAKKEQVIHILYTWT